MSWKERRKLRKKLELKKQLWPVLTEPVSQANIWEGMSTRDQKAGRKVPNFEQQVRENPMLSKKVSICEDIWNGQDELELPLQQLTSMNDLHLLMQGNEKIEPQMLNSNWERSKCDVECYKVGESARVLQRALQPKPAPDKLVSKDTSEDDNNKHCWNGESSAEHLTMQGWSREMSWLVVLKHNVGRRKRGEETKVEQTPPRPEPAPDEALVPLGSSEGRRDNTKSCW